jgi:Chaperone of endosialidase/Head domain of trimeric autotransporter adhesin
MKKLSFIIAIFFYLSFSWELVCAQSTEIKPGNILPKMTTAQRIAIASPQDGMLVFDSNTQSYWYRKSGVWTELPQNNTPVNFWQQTGAAGNEIKNTNTGGFWSANLVGLTESADNISNPPTAPTSGSGTRMMWIPSRSAFRVGTIIDTGWDANNIGLFSFASGLNATASGNYSFSTGPNSFATGSSSLAMGRAAQSTGIGSVAIGQYSTASGNYSTALGENSKALNSHAVAIGLLTIASGQGSLATGVESKASGLTSTAFGNGTKAIGSHSTSMGLSTISNGDYSTAIGAFNTDNPEGLFMVGNGASSSSRYTAFIIRKDNSRVGIGVEDPIARLHVAGSGSPLLVNNGQYFVNAGSFVPYNGASNTSFGTSAAIFADGTITSNSYIGSYQTVVSSDNRIKKDFSLSNNAEDLKRLRKIQITNYRMKDVATWGTQTFKKVIAQQVEEVYPEVIKRQTSVIPDIYALAESVAYDAATKNLSVTLSKDYSIKIGDKLELVHLEKGKILAEVIAVSDKSFTVKNWDYATEKIFVFGRQVNDFRSVDYEALSMLGISAIQQLAKENELLKTKNEKIEARLESIENLLKSNVTTAN